MNNLDDVFSIDNEGRYWFISCISPESGRLIVLGEYPNKDEAERTAFPKLSSYEVFSMPTKDRAKATQHAKYMQWQKHSNLEQAIKRAKHNV